MDCIATLGYCELYAKKPGRYGAAGGTGFAQRNWLTLIPILWAQSDLHQDAEGLPLGRPPHKPGTIAARQRRAGGQKRNWDKLSHLSH